MPSALSLGKVSRIKVQNLARYSLPLGIGPITTLPHLIDYRFSLWQKMKGSHKKK
jgi:hypothetical protein